MALAHDDADPRDLLARVAEPVGLGMSGLLAAQLLDAPLELCEAFGRARRAPATASRGAPSSSSASVSASARPRYQSIAAGPLSASIRRTLAALPGALGNDRDDPDLGGVGDVSAAAKLA